MGGGSSLGWLWVHSPLLSAHPEAPADAQDIPTPAGGPMQRGSFLPEVREFITRHTAYNKHDTGWAKGAPSEDHTTPPSSRTASGGRLVGGAPAGARPFRGWLIPRVPYSGLVPYWEQTAVPATRPREGDVC